MSFLFRLRVVFSCVIPEINEMNRPKYRTGGCDITRSIDRTSIVGKVKLITF